MLIWRQIKKKTDSIDSNASKLKGKTSAATSNAGNESLHENSAKAINKAGSHRMQTWKNKAIVASRRLAKCPSVGVVTNTNTPTPAIPLTIPPSLSFPISDNNSDKVKVSIENKSKR